MSNFFKYFYRHKKYHFFCAVVILFIAIMGLHEVGIDAKAFIGLVAGIVLIGAARLYKKARYILILIGVPGLILLNFSGFQLAGGYKGTLYGLLMGALITLLYGEYLDYKANTKPKR